MTTKRPAVKMPAAVANKPAAKKVAEKKPKTDPSTLQRRLTVRFETDEQKIFLTEDAARNWRSINSEVVAWLFPIAPRKK